MLRSARETLSARWHLLGWLGFALAPPLAVWGLVAEDSLTLAAVVALQGVTLLGLTTVSGRSDVTERRTREIDKRIRRISDALEATRSDVRKIAESQVTATAVSAMSGAQRLDAEIRHQELLGEIGARSEQVGARIGEGVHAVEQTVERTAEALVSENAALLNLFSMFDPHEALPVPGGWAASPQTLLRLANVVLDLPEGGLVVECGSGTSTIWLALACRRAGRSRVVALEHDARFAERTRAWLRGLELDEVAEVRLAPLEPAGLEDESYHWYAREAWSDLADIHLLFVDGPPGRVGPRSRYPAFPMLAGALAVDAVVALDDAFRDDEAAIAADWVKEGAHGVVLRDLDVVGRTRFFAVGNGLATDTQPAG